MLRNCKRIKSLLLYSLSPHPFQRPPVASLPSPELEFRLRHFLEKGKKKGRLIGKHLV
jgi:hypothetical protein